MTIKEAIWTGLAAAFIWNTGIASRDAIRAYKFWSAVNATVTCTQAGVDWDRCRKIIYGDKDI